MAAFQRALFHDHHVQSGLAQHLGTDAATGATADDDHVACQIQIMVERAGIEHLPAAGQPFLPRVGQGVVHRRNP
ncbi:hypothetical protein ACFSQE_09605 [Vogesella fluminis]|uniref:hypothetical protein n=1 Tax=Vogesella fluminis TaxID=1069161 RepID=UPI001E4FB949|nr:hypothetical protein [Vogesella fluminis]